MGQRSKENIASANSKTERDITKGRTLSRTKLTMNMVSSRDEGKETKETLIRIGTSPQEFIDYRLVSQLNRLK